MPLTPFNSTGSGAPPNNTLTERLNAAPSDKAFDAILLDVWQRFADSDMHEALRAEIFTIRSAFAAVALNISSTPEARAFAAGAVTALARLRGRIKAAVDFRPDDHSYDTNSDLDTDDLFDPTTN